MLSIVSPFPQFFDTKGDPLDAGYIYIGVAGQNPEVNPITIFWDDDGTQPAAQPVRTINGFPARTGSPGRLFTPSVDFSITVKDKRGKLLFYEKSAYSMSLISSSSGAGMVGWLPPEAGALATTVADRLRQEAARPEDFMTAGEQAVAYARLGTLDFTVQVQKALDSGKPVELTGLYACGALVAANAAVFGRGILRSLAATAATALLTMTGGSAQGFSIDSPAATPALYGILAHGESPLVEGVTFSGNYGHCLYMSNCRNAQALKNLVKQGGSHIAAMVFESCTGFKAIGNTIEEHSGFGIQARFSGLGVITGNSISQRYFSQSFTATAATQTFTVTNDRTCMRFSAYCDGQFRTVTGTTQVGTSNSYQVTVAGLTVGQPVAIYSFVGLECIQANSGCYDITITANSVNCSGDSGIVVGADYHYNGTTWVLDAGAVVMTDYPARVVVHGNPIRGPILGAGVAINNGVDCQAYANPIENVGYTDLVAYKTGISLGLVYGGIYRDNIADGTNGHMLGALKFVGGQNLRRPPTIGRNRGIGCKSFEAFPVRSTTERSFGYDIIDAKVDDLITRSIEQMLESSWTGGNFTGNNIALFVAGGTGISKDSSVVDSYFTSIKTLAGQYADLVVNAGTLQMFKDKLVRISFKAKADVAGNTGFVQLFYGFPGDDVNPPVTLDITDATQWVPFTVTMALGAVNGLSVRIGGNTGVVRISRLRFDMLDIEG